MTERLLVATRPLHRRRGRPWRCMDIEKKDGIHAFKKAFRSTCPPLSVYLKKTQPYLEIIRTVTQKQAVPCRSKREEGTLLSSR